MQTKKWQFTERFQDLPDGPWKDEACDKMQWQDEATGLPCLVVRNRMGAWCGYVGVDETHPFYGKNYDDLGVSVHGGLTFSDLCSPAPNDEGICHVPDEGEPDNLFWFGFDCAHYNDLIPGMLKYRTESGLSAFSRYTEREAYRTLDYVQEQCRQLAAQLKAWHS